jgi:sugar phosphate isomerase/epimerase
MKSLVLCDNCKPEEVLNLCNIYGLGIEIQGFYNPNLIDKKEERILDYKNLLPEKIEKHFHAPFWDLCLGSANDRIKEVTNFYFDYAYKIAEELGCQTITVHQGYIPNTSNINNWIKRSIKFWQDFFETHQSNIIMCMENLCEQDPETLIGIVDSLENENIGINLDIGHANCNSDMSPLAWIKQLGNRITYVHLHDNFGENDDHLSLGKGSMSMIEILNALNKYAPDAIWALECNTEDMQESIEYLINNGYF